LFDAPSAFVYQKLEPNGTAAAASAAPISASPTG
jgi:hypothetical protein